VPTYDYQCRDCGNVIEVIHPMLDAGPSVCERCGGALRRVIYPTGIIFKGSGFYRTDSRQSGSGAESATPAPASSGSDGKSSDRQSSDKKPAKEGSSSSTTSGAGSGSSST
jgi:putative FmdB family regulatory protein